MLPVTVTRPDFLSSSPKIELRRDDLPQPTVPTIAVRLPLATLRLIPSRVGLSFTKQKLKQFSLKF
jgi:hypothetical protein